MRIRIWKSMCLIAVLATLGFAGTAQAVDFSFGFGGTEYADNFLDVRRGSEINSGPDLGGTGNTAVNFTGTTGSAGDTWITIYTNTTTSGPSGGKIVFGGGGLPICLSADVLIHRFNNRKGGGLLALWNGTAQNTPPTATNGLALIVNDNGNTDALVLSTVDNFGKLTQLASVPLGSSIAENVWVRLTATISTTDSSEFEVDATVKSHTTPTDPNSGLGGTLGTLAYEINSNVSTLGLSATGKIGMIASAVSAVVDTSITNFTLTETGCVDVEDP